MRPEPDLTLTNASLNFDINVFTSDDVDGGPEALLYLFDSDGIFDVGDLDRTDLFAGTTPEVDELGTLIAPLDLGAVNTLLATGTE